MKKKIFLADLTHTSRGIHASTFPLGTAFVASYAKKVLGDHFDIQLFKLPEKMLEAIKREQPAIIGCSNYSWNLELGYKICSIAKEKSPHVITIFGGPNFPVNRDEKIKFLKERSLIDFYIENEGEIAFASLVELLLKHQLDVGSVKLRGAMIANCNYLKEGALISGPIERIKDPNVIPSPYLTGVLDDFFELPLAPMLETARGCPFTCAFCADGLLTKSRVTRFDEVRTKEELAYISKRIGKIDELIITDLNFGMYDQDRKTATEIAKIQEKKHWPVIVSGSAGKNRPKQIIGTLSLLKGSWKVGSAMQSSDPEVLKNIKRSNISLEAYRQFLDFGNSLDKDAQTFTEIILGLPGDTKEKHFESLRYGVENGAGSVRMYQAILLLGTDMASQETRLRFGLKTKFRIIPGAVGNYTFGKRSVPVAEIEEIVVGSNDLSFEDYVSCRVMNLIIETYLNNALFEELFAVAKTMNLKVFDCLKYIHEHPELYTDKVHTIIDEFIAATKFDLYDSREEAERYVLDPKILAQYVNGELGTNELLVHRAMLYLELEDITEILLAAVVSLLRARGHVSEATMTYLKALARFTVVRKRKFYLHDEDYEESFLYNFEEIAARNFSVSPEDVTPERQPKLFRFFHVKEQKEHIRNSMNLYANTPSGLGRLIQRSNLKKMYRYFESKAEKQLNSA